MGEKASSSGWFDGPWWKIDKEAWKTQFSFLTKINSLKAGLERPLPPWTLADVEKFAEEEPKSGAEVYPLFPVSHMRVRPGNIESCNHFSILLRQRFSARFLGDSHDIQRVGHYFEELKILVTPGRTA